MTDAKDDFEDAVKAEFVLRPSRSLTPRGQALFYGSLLAGAALVNIFAFNAGVWPVAVFVDLAAGGAATAMMLSSRSGGEYERLTLRPSALEIRHYKPGFAQERLFTVSPFMLKIEDIKDSDGNCERLLLKSSGKTIEIGAFLPPSEKVEVAQALRAALKKAQAPAHLQRDMT